MWRGKKLLLIVLLATVVLVGSIGGVVYAQTNNGDDGISPSKTLLARVAEKLNIDEQTLIDAMSEARSEMQAEALDNRLANLVAEGTITQEQADQYKAWLQARPDMEQFRQQVEGWQQARPEIPQEFKDWQEARPDIPIGPGLGERGGPGGFGGPRLPMFGGPCSPME